MKTKKWMKKITLSIASVLLICTMFLTQISEVYAASFGMSASASTIYYGNKFTVTVNLSNGAGRVNLSCSNGTLSQTSIWLDQSSATVTVTPKAVGTVVVSASATYADYDTALDVSENRSVSVNVINKPANKPANNSSSTSKPQQVEKDTTLKIIEVSEGVLSPKFDKDTKNYEVVVSGKVNTLNVSAETSDTNASVSGTGEVELKEKETEVVLKVSNGDDTSEYKINIIKEIPVVSIDKLGILNEFRNAPVLEGFEEYKFNVGDVEVIGKKKIDADIVVVYAVDEKGNKDYYMYDEKKGKITSTYTPIALFGKKYAIISIPKKLKEMEGFKFGKVKLGETTLEGWTFKDKAFKNYALVYLMNEEGKANLYQYETSENSLQLYSNAASITQDAYVLLQEEKDMYQMFTYILAPTCGIIAVSALTLAISMKKKKK